MRQNPKPQDFQKFYFRYLGKGEACGCAERIIDVHEFNRLSGREARELKPRKPLLKHWKAKLLRNLR